VARYNEVLTGRFNRALQKIFSMKGDAVSPQLAGEIQPAISFPTGAEFRYLEQWNLFSFGGSVTGGAGQFAGIRLNNPAGSNVVGVVYFLIVGNGATGNQNMQIGLGPITGPLATVGTPNRLDARSQLGGARGVLIPSTSTNTGGAFSPQIGQLFLLPQTSLIIISSAAQEIPLLPGDGLEVDAGNAAQTVLTWFMWRERQLEESERA
jgi:hypothetical protein